MRTIYGDKVECIYYIDINFMNGFTDVKIFFANYITNISQLEKRNNFVTREKNFFVQPDITTSKFSPQYNE
jgi:hypothetical protein